MRFMSKVRMSRFFIAALAIAAAPVLAETKMRRRVTKSNQSVCPGWAYV